MANISIQYFWFYTIGLILIWTIVLAARIDALSTNTIKPYENKDKEVINSKNCEALCGNCGCMNFYCGEECICECNQDNRDTECIKKIQDNAEQLKTPFEILIQGPTVNRFVRNALQFDQNKDLDSLSNLYRNKRSSVVIYKPTALNVNSLNSNMHDYKKSATLRNKRSITPQWFTDIASSLVRPAPIGGTPAPKKPIEEPEMPQKRSADEKPWFAENTNMLIRPSPFFKRNRYNQINDNESDNYESDAQLEARKIVEKLPQAIKETIRNIQDSGIGENLSDALRMTINDGREALENTFKDGQEALENTFSTKNFDLLNKENNAEKSPLNLEKTFKNMNLFGRLKTQDSEEMTTTTASPKLFIPWFRPVRFLQRVNEVIS